MRFEEISPPLVLILLSGLGSFSGSRWEILRSNKYEETPYIVMFNDLEKLSSNQLLKSNTSQ